MLNLPIIGQISDIDIDYTKTFNTKITLFNCQKEIILSGSIIINEKHIHVKDKYYISGNFKVLVPKNVKLFYEKYKIVAEIISEPVYIYMISLNNYNVKEGKNITGKKREKRDDDDDDDDERKKRRKIVPKNLSCYDFLSNLYKCKYLTKFDDIVNREDMINQRYISEFGSTKGLWLHKSYPELFTITIKSHINDNIDFDILNEASIIYNLNKLTRYKDTSKYKICETFTYVKYITFDESCNDIVFIEEFSPTDLDAYVENKNELYKKNVELKAE